MPEMLDKARPETSGPAGATRVSALRAAARRHPRRGIAVLMVVLVAVGGTVWWSQRGLPGNVAVRVGDQDITVTELRGRMATVEALYGVTVPDGDEKVDFWRDAAHSVALGVVLDDAAVDSDVSISDPQVDQSLQQVITSFFGEGDEGEAAFAEALSTAGTSEKAVRDELQRQLKINALFAQVTGDVASPDDAAVAAAYDERRCGLRLPEKRRLRNVVTSSREDAEDAVRRLRKGDAFASVVAALSIDASTRGTGGDLGLVARSDLEADYAKAAFGAGRGELYGPVRGTHGWNVGRVEAIRPGRMPTLAEARDGLRQTLFSEAQSKVWRQWLAKQLKSAEVRYGDGYAPDDPLALPDDGLAGQAPEASGASGDC